MINSSKAAPVRTRPIAPVAVLFVVVTIAHALLVGCGGGAKENGSSSETPPPVETSTPDTSATAVAGGDEVAAGKAIYIARCALCHGNEGKGDGPAAAGLNPKPRNHTDGTYMKTLSDEALLQVIHTGKGAMPAWGSILSEAEISAVAKYVRTLAK
jgi:mono/diheme cytochrome c family protein